MVSVILRPISQLEKCPNPGKYGPEKLRVQTLFTQCLRCIFSTTLKKTSSKMFDGILNTLATLLKRRLWHRCFPVNFAKFLRTPFLTKHLQ